MMLSERQTRYKQIAAFYLDEDNPSSQGQVYLPGEEEPASEPVKEVPYTEMLMLTTEESTHQDEADIFFNPIRQDDEDSTYKSEIELDLNYSLPVSIEQKKSSSYGESPSSGGILLNEGREEKKKSSSCGESPSSEGILLNEVREQKKKSSSCGESPNSEGILVNEAKEQKKSSCGESPTSGGILLNEGREQKKSSSCGESPSSGILLNEGREEKKSSSCGESPTSGGILLNEVREQKKSSSCGESPSSGGILVNEGREQKSFSHGESPISEGREQKKSSSCGESPSSGGILVNEGRELKKTNSVRWLEQDGSEGSSEQHKAGSSIGSEEDGMPVGTQNEGRGPRELKKTNSVRWLEQDGSEISSEQHRAASSICSDDLADGMAVGTPHIMLQAPDTPVGCHPSRPTSLYPPPADADGLMKRKSPVTVQEWVDRLPVKPAVPNLKAEEPIIENASMLRCQSAARLSREASVQSSSSLDSLLDSRKPDPVEVLLNLGFGGVPGIDLDNCRIPKRFLVPSKCKGGDWDEFLRRELLQVQNFECASLGFRGLSGPSHQRPSAIVANIMDKLRDQGKPRPLTPKTRFTAVAKRVLSETSVLSRLTPTPNPPSPLATTTTSVLTPDNRKFLESQGKVSPEVPRRRVIMGKIAYKVDKDGELVEVEPQPIKPSTGSEVSSWSAGSAVSVESDSEDGKSEHFPSAAELLRMRRSSLQRQRNVEVEEDEIEDEPAVPLRFLVVPEDSENLRDTLASEIDTLSRKIKSAPPGELAAILDSIKGLQVKLNDL